MMTQQMFEYLRDCIEEAQSAAELSQIRRLVSDGWFGSEAMAGQVKTLCDKRLLMDFSKDVVRAVR